MAHTMPGFLGLSPYNADGSPNYAFVAALDYADKGAVSRVAMLPSESFLPANMPPPPVYVPYSAPAIAQPAITQPAQQSPGAAIRVRSSIVNMPADYEASGPAAWTTADLNKPAVQPEQKSNGLFALLALAAAAMTFGG